MKETIWTNVPVILVVSANYRGWEGGISIVKSSRPRIDTLIVVLTVKTEEANTITTCLQGAVERRYMRRLFRIRLANVSLLPGRITGS